MFRLRRALPADGGASLPLSAMLAVLDGKAPLGGSGETLARAGQMSVDNLLSQLDGVRRTGQGRWLARCPAHPDKRPSLSIRELDDGRILAHDFGGCSVEEVLGAIGLEFDALFPERRIGDDGKPLKPIKRPWRAADVIHALEFELTVCWVLLAEIAQGDAIDPARRERAGECRRRILRFLHEIQHAT